MAYPAHRNAAGPGDAPAGRPGPGIRRALAAEARACRLAVEEMARRPGDPAALEMAAAVLSVLEDLREMARGLDFGEAFTEEACARAVAADRAARPAGRRRPRGHLRAL